MKPILLAGLAALGGLMFLRPSTAGAKQPPKPGEPGGPPASSQPGANVLPPADVAVRVATALATLDPPSIRAAADKLDAEGWKAQAADLRAAAVKIERERASSGGSSSPGQPPIFQPPPPPVNPPPFQVPPIVVPGTTVPPAPVPPAVVPADPRRELAGRTALMLMTRARGREDKALVAQFQAQEKLNGTYTGAVDQLYGPKTALAFVALGIVPPKPFYWPKASPAQSKAEYRAKLLAQAQRDPQRAEEWRQAAAV